MNRDDLKTLSDDFRKRTDDELAEIRTNKIDTSLHAILIDKEFERRARIAQHELDLQLVLKQVQWMKFAAILGAIATLIGGIAGAILTFWLQN